MYIHSTMIASSLLTSLRPTLGLCISHNPAACDVAPAACSRPAGFLNVCANLAISKPALTRSLDRLTALGFVERSRSDGDRRKTAITEKG
jgi:hypothetical protein